MKKLQQTVINKEVMEVYDDLEQCIYYHGMVKIGRLRTCSAIVYQTKGYTFLKSYDTIVAAIGDCDCTCYDFLRMVYGYTATSAQHIAKFRKDYFGFIKKTYYPV